MQKSGGRDQSVNPSSNYPEFEAKEPLGEENIRLLEDDNDQ
jgi:hypothetical protein